MIDISNETVDAAWDTFVAQTPGGHHVQTSQWARVKAWNGWRTTRVLVKHGPQIVGGAQLLSRSVSPFGAIVHIPKGPLFAVGDPSLSDCLLTQIQQLAKAQGMQFLVLQPPDNGDAFVSHLTRAGFQPSLFEPMPVATVRIDITPSPDLLLSQMRRKTRQAIRRGLRRGGLCVREGQRDDIATFHRLLVLSGQRLGFSPYSQDFYANMWACLAPNGYLRLTLAEYRGEAVAAHLVAPFGDTILGKQSGWSGQYRELQPNELLHWETMRWGRAHGFRYYDLDGIDSRAALALSQGNPLPKTFIQSATSFKLGFGGEVVQLPQSYDYILHPALRCMYTRLVPYLAHWPLMHHIIDRFRIA